MPEFWDTDRIYTYEENGQWFYFFSPDGVGRIWYDTLAETKEQSGLTSVVHLMAPPID